MTQAPTIDGLREENGGTLPHSTDLGGYPLFYMSNEGTVFCTDCANQEDAEPEIRYYDINWEDPDLYCDGCSERIESAYAED